MLVNSCHALKQWWIHFPAGRRDFSAVFTSRAQATEKSPFKDALRLPRTSFPLRSDPIKSEQPFRAKTCDELYKWQACHSSPSGRSRSDTTHSGRTQMARCSYYTTALLTRTAVCIWVCYILIVLPPNSSSETGHALNKIIKDIINRYNVLIGRKVQ
jgi:isoleucyl-tRNA synthetase